MHYTTYTIIYTMHIAYYTDTTTIARNENARYHTEIHRLCASTYYCAVLILRCATKISNKTELLGRKE